MLVFWAAANHPQMKTMMSRALAHLLNNLLPLVGYCLDNTDFESDFVNRNHSVWKANNDLSKQIWVVVKSFLL